eukprot:SM000307S11681  [mRNA]  locus=s307:31508:38289:+ [translate_table: standard]
MATGAGRGGGGGGTAAAAAWRGAASIAYNVAVESSLASSFVRRLAWALRAGLAVALTSALVATPATRVIFPAVPYFAVVIAIVGVNEVLGKTVSAGCTMVAGAIIAASVCTLVRLAAGSTAATTYTSLGVTSFLYAYFTFWPLSDPLAKKITQAISAICYFSTYSNPGLPKYFAIEVAATTALGAVCAVIALSIPIPRLARFEIHSRLIFQAKCTAALFTCLLEAYVTTSDRSASQLRRQAKVLLRAAVENLRQMKLRIPDLAWEPRLSWSSGVDLVTEYAQVVSYFMEHCVAMDMALEDHNIHHPMHGPLKVTLAGPLRHLGKVTALALLKHAKSVVEATSALGPCHRAMLGVSERVDFDEELCRSAMDVFDAQLVKAREAAYYKNAWWINCHSHHQDSGEERSFDATEKPEHASKTAPLQVQATLSTVNSDSMNRLHRSFSWRGPEHHSRRLSCSVASSRSDQSPLPGERPLSTPSSPASSAVSDSAKCARCQQIRSAFKSTKMQHGSRGAGVGVAMLQEREAEQRDPFAGNDGNFMRGFDDQPEHLHAATRVDLPVSSPVPSLVVSIFYLFNVDKFVKVVYKAAKVEGFYSEEESRGGGKSDVESGRKAQGDRSNKQGRSCLGRLWRQVRRGTQGQLREAATQSAGPDAVEANQVCSRQEKWWGLGRFKCKTGGKDRDLKDGTSVSNEDHIFSWLQHIVSKVELWGLLEPLKRCIAILCAGSIGQALTGSGLWSALTAAFVGGARVGGSLAVSLQRLEGTVVGTITGYLLLDATNEEVAWVVVSLAVFCFAAGYVRSSVKHGYAGTVASFTCAVVLLAASASPLPRDQYALNRIESTCIGVLAVVLVDLLVLPRRAALLVRHEVRKNLDTFANFFQTMEAVYMREGCMPRRIKAVEKVKALGKQAAASCTLQKLLLAEAAGEPQLWHRPYGANVYKTIVDVEESILWLLVMIRRSILVEAKELVTEQLHHLVHPMKSSLDAIGAGILESLEAIMSVLDGLAEFEADVEDSDSVTEDEQERAQRSLARDQLRQGSSHSQSGRSMSTLVDDARFARVQVQLAAACARADDTGNDEDHEEHMGAHWPPMQGAQGQHAYGQSKYHSQLGSSSPLQGISDNIRTLRARRRVALQYFDARYEVVVARRVAWWRAHPGAPLLSSGAMLSFGAFVFGTQRLINDVEQLESAVQELLQVEKPLNVSSVMQKPLHDILMDIGKDIR